MKTLFRWKNKPYEIHGLRYRSFSVIANAEAELASPINKDHVWLDATANLTKVSNLQAILQFSARERVPVQGKVCHAKIMRMGIKDDIITSNMLVNMYSKCGLVEEARKVFDEMPERSMVSWNTMIGMYTGTANGHEQEALSLFVNMLSEGKNPVSEFCVSGILCACAAKYYVFECKQLHAFAIKTATDWNVFVGTALLGVYAKCGLVKDACRVFEYMPEKNGVTWSSMVAGFVQNELYEEALALFRRAQGMGLEHSQFTISSVICASASLASLIQGKQVHAVSCKTGFSSNMFVASSLIDMYAKCGVVVDAYIVFSDMEEKNVVLWNAMISGFSRHARYAEVMILFEKMQQMGLYPDECTYISVLFACGHAGLVDKGQGYFNIMVKQHNVSPNVLHYACMVDILGRAGLIREAYNLIERMPFDATASMWGSLLTSCRNNGSIELAEIAAKHLFEMEPGNAGNHLLLSKIYAGNRRWEEVVRSRKFIRDSELKKERGKSWIEIDRS